MGPQEQALSIGRISGATRRAELERFEAQLAEWTALIGQFRAHARRAEAPKRAELDTLTDELQHLRNEASAQVMRLKCASDGTWEHERAQLDRSWQAVRTSFQKAEGLF